jgi:hydrogenase maturation protein HypF
MLRNGINSPLASSCGRLFDAVAAALGICRERQRFEAEAACALERLVDVSEDGAYRFEVGKQLDPLPMWRALFADLRESVAPVAIAARFHNGLARALAAMAKKWDLRTAALSGGCFQNKVLLARTQALLEAEGFMVLVHRGVPAHDGGLALGQAAIGAARALEKA